LPLILIRGFGGIGVEDEKRIAYQGFNDGTVYPQKRGENYIYEGLILRFLKSNWQYRDATNVVGYYSSKAEVEPALPDRLKHLKDQSIVARFKRMQELRFFSGDRVVIDPAMALYLLESTEDPCRSLWVFRYYDLNDRTFATYGRALIRLIDFIRELAADKEGIKPKVNVIAHSMGGLLVREAIQRTYPESNRKADEYINKIVTLGTPHQGISFQFFKDWIGIAAEEEVEHFNPEFQKNPQKPEAFVNFHKYFPLDRLLTVVGTNYRSYAALPASWANRLFSVAGEYGPTYNRSDGLVKQSYAQIPGAPRTFIHKCHGGFDSLVTSRESFEVATRFFFGNVRTRLRLVSAKITRGKDWFGKSEFFLGVCIKPRRVDFELFHQSPEAENCYGPFRKDDLSDEDENVAFGWAGVNRLIWEGYLDTSSILRDVTITTKDMVMRLDFYIGERDMFGVGFSDNVIFRKQYYIRALLEPQLQFYLYSDERFAEEGGPPESNRIGRSEVGWDFQVKGTGFEGTFCLEVDEVPSEGSPVAIQVSQAGEH
jgi:hypothetical protein